MSPDVGVEPCRECAVTRESGTESDIPRWLEQFVRHWVWNHSRTPDSEPDSAAQSARNISRMNIINNTRAILEARVEHWKTVSHATHLAASLRLPLHSKENSQPPK